MQQVNNLSCDSTGAWFQKNVIITSCLVEKGLNLSPTLPLSLSFCLCITFHLTFRFWSRSRSELAPLSALAASPTRGPLTFSQRAAPIRLPRHKAPPSASSQLRLPRPFVPVPHGARNSTYTDSFSVPPPPPMSSTHAAEPKRTEESGRGLLQHILGVPEMYGTENQTYGKGRMALVWDKAQHIHYSPDLAIFIHSLNNGCSVVWF